MLRRAAIVAALVMSAATGARAAEQPREEDLRIVEVVLDEVVLSEAIAAYAGSTGGTLLPLQAVSELIGVAVTATPDEGTASGFILDERRTFRLDVGRGQVTIAGKQARFDPALVRAHDDDIYVDSELLGSWLPAAFDVDLFALRIRIRPREPLPLQTRLERERRIRHWRLQLPPANPGYPRQPSPYRLWDVPFVDQTLRLSLGESSRASFATYATGDLLYMESEAYLAGGNGDLFDAARLTLRRRDPGGAIGRIGATEVAVGHVIHPSSGLLTVSGESLPGLLVTNMPLNRPTEFDRHEFRGNLPPGWDVELYHNDALLDYQQSRPDGQYAFSNVPVLFGMNFFRLVFYGPQGQRREEHHRFLLGESLTHPGRLEYRVVANVERQDARRASALLSYGLGKHLTATAETASLPTPDGERQYGKLGLRTFWNALFAYGDVVQDRRGGRAWDAGLQTRLFGVNVVLAREAASRGFVSEVFPVAGDPVVSRDRLRLDAAVPAWILPRIPVTLELERHRLASGATRTVAQNRLSTHYRGLSLTNRALWTWISGQPARADAALQVSRYVRGFGIRGELAYGLAPMDVTTANVTIEKPLASGYRVYANVSASLHGGAHSYSVGFDKTTGPIAAGVTAMRDPQGNTGGTVDLSTGLGRDPRAGAWVPSARARAASGALSARVFLDRDENGRFDPGDQPLPGVGMTINGIERPERTTEEGIVFLPDLSPHQPADVALDARTLEDPQWVSDARGVRVTPRPGNAVQLELPVVATADIEGSVYTMRDGRREDTGGVKVELTDAEGKVVQQTTAAYDGFYVFTHVRRGRYSVRLARPSGELRKEVAVAQGQPVITGVDFVLPPRAGAPAAVPPPVAIAEAVPVTPATPSVRAPVPATEEEYAVQVGTFRVRENAERQAAAARRFASDVTLLRVGEFVAVRSGPRTRAAAARLARELTGQGLEAALVRLNGVAESPAAACYVVQFGAFRIAANAADLVRRLEQRGINWRGNIDRRGALFFVQTAPFPSRDAAENARDALRGLRFDAVVRDCG